MIRTKKIAVLHAQVPFRIGGAETQVDKLVEKLRGRNFHVDLISLPYKWYPDTSLYSSLLMWRMLDLEESDGEKIDLVIGTKFPSYGAKHSNKVAWVIHQMRQMYDLYDSPFGASNWDNGAEMKAKVEHFDQLALSECKNLFADSKNVRDRMLKHNGIYAKPLYHPPALVGRYYTTEFQPYILSVGRLDKLKRIDLLIKAMVYTSNACKAKIAGSGSELESLKKLAMEMGVEDKVEFLGFVSTEELLDLYAGAGAVYFCPVDEDYGYITLESFLSRKPVVTCIDSGGVLEFVRDNESGYVSLPEAQALGEAIEALLMNPMLAKAMGEVGYEKVRHIHWDYVLDRLTETI